MRGSTDSKVLHKTAHIIVTADHPQYGGAAFKFEDYADIPTGPKFKIVSLQPSNPKAAVLMRLAECFRQRSHGMGDLILPFGGQYPRFRPKTGSELNP